MSAIYEPIIISKSLIDLLMKHDPKNWTKLYSLYSFYYYTAKYKKIDQIKCTIKYTIEGTGWSNITINKYRKELIKLKLIENIKIKDKNNRIIEYCTKVNFIWE